MTGGGAGSRDSLRLGVEAAEIGTWNWHILSGRVVWTPWTYQLFGLQPDGVLTSHELFLHRVHAPDRPLVDAWISRAIEERKRTVLEFRVERMDGTVRWARSIGRVLVDERGKPVRMVGVVEDVTDCHEIGGHAPVPILGSFSPRQVAQMLGVAEITVKRLAGSGQIRMLRSSQKNSRRFAAEDILEYLRKTVVDGEADFESTVAAGDMRSCLVHILDRMSRGTSLEALLDDGRLATPDVAPAEFIEDLLSRMPFMAPERQHSAFPALLVQVGSAARDSALIRCVLHARGYDVLRAAGHPDPVQLAEVARRVRARFVIFVIAPDSTAIQACALATASAIGEQLGPGAVLAQFGGEPRAPQGVTRFRSMRELGSLLE